MDEFLFYSGPNYAGHFVAVEFDYGVDDFDFLVQAIGRHGSRSGRAVVGMVVVFGFLVERQGESEDCCACCVGVEGSFKLMGCWSPGCVHD